MATPNDGADLHHATETNDFQLAKDILLRNPGCVDNQVNGWTALHTAARWGHEKLASLLLEMGAAVNMPTQTKNASAVMLAVNWGHNSVIARLIEWGADVNQAANEHWVRNTPLHIAAALENTGTLHLLLLYGAAVRATNLEGKMPLDVAVKHQHKSSMVILQEFAGLARNNVGRGIRSRILEFQMGDFVDRSGEIHLDAGALWATSRGHVAVAEYLLDIDQRLVDVCSDDFWSLLHIAAWNGNIDSVKLLLERGAQVDSCTKDRGCTPLHLAAQRGHQEIVKLLLDRGAELYTQTHRGSTARMLAIRGNHQHVARVIDEHAKKGPKGFHRDANAPIRRSLPIPRRRERQVSLENYHFQERDENDSSDERVQHDGRAGHLSEIKSNFGDRRTFTLLITAWKDWCESRRSDVPVKIAIIDTGLDLKNRDLNLPRVEAFVKGRSGDLETRLAEGETAAQFDRVKGQLNLARGIQQGELDIQDLDGHGTRVAGIILRLAPTADLYIARVCDGNHRSAKATVDPTCRNVADAIQWAIEKKVNIINISLGFKQPDGNIRRKAQEAKEAGILIFAAMSNSGNYPDEPDWPARDFATTIGIHSCKPKGTFPSEFTPPAIPGNPNFMVAGEAIIVHKFPYPAGASSPRAVERFELAAGTSYATPVATSMAALILAFVRQDLCRPLRRQARKNGLDVTALLRDHHYMAGLFKEIAKPTGDYLWISPELLWKGFQPPADGKGVPRAGREYAWDIICKALR
ncbi:ankyrin [Xylariaceae sp. AK1471]|nr:ankyrin [Xylariaceae sp. AK1471]